MKKIRFILFLLVVVAGVAAALVFWKHYAEPAEEEPNNIAEISSHDACVAAGYPVMESYPQQCKTPDGRTFVQDIGNELEKQDLIRISAPRPNETVVSPLTITGEARGYWFFEATFPVTMLNSKGEIIGQHYAQAEGEWMTEEFVPFTVVLEFTGISGERGTLLLEKDNASGLPEHDDQLRIPVVFGEQQTMQITAFFTTPGTGQEPDFDCALVAPVTRTIPKTQSVARAALAELLKGPAAGEQAQGFATSLPSGDIAIQSLVIAGGVARVDFSDTLEHEVGGSCRVTSIRSQIESTLKQFPTVQSVVISIDGRTEDILQP